MLRTRSKMAESYVGSKISLLASTGVRYEGVLWSMDIKKSRIGVKSVRSYGTEDRKTERQVDPSNEIYDLIVFRGEELDDLRVIEETRLPSAAEAKRRWDASTWLSGNGNGVTREDMANGYSHILPYYAMSAHDVNRDSTAEDQYSWRQQPSSTSAPSSASNYASNNSLDRPSIATSVVHTDLRHIPGEHDAPYSAVKHTHCVGPDGVLADTDIPYSALKHIHADGFGCMDDLDITESEIPISAMKRVNYGMAELDDRDADIPYSARKSINYEAPVVADSDQHIPYSAMKGANYSGKDAATVLHIPYAALKSPNYDDTHTATSEQWQAFAHYQQPYCPRYHFVPQHPQAQQHEPACHVSHNGRCTLVTPPAPTPPPPPAPPPPSHTAARNSEQKSQTQCTAPPGSCTPLPGMMSSPPTHQEIPSGGDEREQWERREQQTQPPTLREGEHVAFHAQYNDRANGPMEVATYAGPTTMERPSDGSQSHGAQSAQGDAPHSTVKSRNNNNNNAPNNTHLYVAPSADVYRFCRPMVHPGDAEVHTQGRRWDVRDVEAIVKAGGGQQQDSSQWYGVRNPRNCARGLMTNEKDTSDISAVVGNAFDAWAAHGRGRHGQHLARQNDHRQGPESSSPGRGVNSGLRRFAETHTPPEPKREEMYLQGQETYGAPRPQSSARGERSDDAVGLPTPSKDTPKTVSQRMGLSEGKDLACGVPWNVQQEWAPEGMVQSHYEHKEDRVREAGGDERWCGDNDQEWPQNTAEARHAVNHDDWAWKNNDDIDWLGQGANGGNDSCEWESWDKKEASMQESGESLAKHDDVRWGGWNVEDYRWGDQRDVSTPEAHTRTSAGSPASAREMSATADNTPQHSGLESAECPLRSSTEFSAVGMSLQDDQVASGVKNDAKDNGCETGEIEMGGAELVTASDEKNQAGEPGTAKSQRGPKFSSLNDVFNYHSGSEAVFLEHLCQSGPTAFSASHLRSLSERSSVVYHVYLDFVNFCCSFDGQMNDEALWEKFAVATRKTFAQQYDLPSEPPSTVCATQDVHAARKPVAPAAVPRAQSSAPLPPKHSSANGGPLSTAQARRWKVPLSPPSTSRNEVPCRVSRTVTLADFAPKKGTKRKPKAAAVHVKRAPPKAPAASTSLPIRLQDGSWSCPRCTLQNNYFHLECAACACPLEHASLLSEFPPLGS